jgi:glycine/D-amino acid oxidase-like deaminating enzyme
VRVLIVGAGIAGACVARALVARGLRPTVVAMDHGMSVRGAGVVSAQFVDADLRTLAIRGREILRRTTSIHGEGFAQIATTASGARRLDGLVDVDDRLPDALARRLDAAFRRRIVRTAFAADDLIVRPAEVVRAFLRGVRRTRARVLAVRDGVVDTTAGRIAADRVVVAAGTWTEPLVAGVRIRREPARIARARVTVPISFHVVESGFYARPDGAGHAIVGDGSLPAIRREAARVLGRGVRCVGAGGGEIAVAPRGRPIVRRVDKTTYVVAGLGGDGLALGPALGERVASMLLDGAEAGDAR